MGGFSFRCMMLWLVLWGAAAGVSAAELPNALVCGMHASVVVGSPQRIHVFFTGKVQGVGFRQTARDVAVDLGLKGWIKNLADSRVEMVVEGPDPDLRLLMDKLRGDFEVEETEIRVERPSGNLKGFEIVQ